MVSDLNPADGDLPSPVGSEPREAPIQPGIAASAESDPMTGGDLSQSGERWLYLALAVLASLAIFLGWRAYFHSEEGDPVASAMLAFEKQNSLVVFASRFEVVAESEYEQTVAAIPVRRVRQAAIIPASIDYRLDLSGISQDDFQWDEATSTLGVTLPQLQTSQPNLDESEARIFTEGLLNTGGSQQLLSERNSRVAERKAIAFAKNPEILSLARSAAKDAIRQNLAVPLQVAGFDDARVVVRFEGEENAF